MMSYATVRDLRQRIGPNVFDEIYGPLRDGSDDPAEDDLESACAEIDGAIAARYRTPAQGLRTLALLKDWTLTLAEERSYSRSAGSTYAEKVKLRVEQVRKYLEMIRTDQFRLPDAPEKNTPGSGITLVKADDPVFARDKMRGF